MSSDQPVRRRRRHRRPLLLAALLGLLLFSAGEIAVRLLRDDLDLMAYTGRREGTNPMAGWAFVDAFGAFRGQPGLTQTALGKSINGHGFMGTPELTLEKPDGVLRVVFLGGSSTSGQGFDLADEETWPWRVMERLRVARPGQELEFINAALGGYSSFESLGMLWARLRFFEPDVVVVNHGWNEMYYWNAERMDDPTSWRRLDDGDWSLHRFLPREPPLEPWVIDPLLAWSQLAIRLRLKLDKNLSGEVSAWYEGPLAAHYDSRGAALFGEHLELLELLCGQFGAELFVTRQPTLVTEGLSEELAARCDFGHHGFDLPAHVRAYAELYGVVDATIPAERVIDLTDLNGRGDLFEDHVHPNASGADAIAERVAAALLERSTVLGGG